MKTTCSFSYFLLVKELSQSFAVLRLIFLGLELLDHHFFDPHIQAVVCVFIILERLTDAFQISEPEQIGRQIHRSVNEQDHINPHSTVYEQLESLNRTAELPVFNLQVNVLPSLFELVGLLFVPIQIKVSLVVSLEHPFADHSGLLKLILQVVKYFTFLIDFGPPLLQINIFYTMYIYHAQYINAFNNTKYVM